MRKITGAQISTFMTLLFIIIGLSFITTSQLASRAIFDELYPLAFVVILTLSFYGFAFITYRLSHKLMPLAEGDLNIDSPEEFAYQVDTLFRLVLFYPLIRTYFIPTPLMRLVYQALGTKMGTNTYSGGSILDPALTVLGANTIIGHDAVLFSHVIEGSHMALLPITIGDNVTIGAKASIMPGVIIENDAVVSVGAVVLKGTHIKAGEKWGGVPAKKLSPRTEI